MTPTIAATLPLLIIEDEPSVMHFVRSALERGGYLCQSANSAAEGIRMLATENYSGIISDMRTPGGKSGADVYEWIAAHRPQLLDRIFFITGDIVNPETTRTLAQTGVPYIEKPFRVQQLLAMAQQLFGTQS